MKRLLYALIGALLVAPGAAAQKPHVVVIHDMEGLAGEDDIRQFMYSSQEQYKVGRQLLVNDVNAVIQGLFDGGAGRVSVIDSHGSGNGEPDLPLDLLDPRAQFVFKDEPFDPDTVVLAPDHVDAVALVGMHAKTGSRGFASHTITLGMGVDLNGRSVTESEWFGYSWGRIGVPVIFVAGDDHLRDDIRSTMPWVHFVVTKHATSASTAELRPVDAVHAEMRTEARNALQQIRSARVLTIAAPFRATLTTQPPASLDVLRGVPGVSYRDNSVTFTASSIPEAYNGLMALVRVAQTAYTRVFNETLRNLPNSAELGAQYREALLRQWVDFESGRWAPPTVPPARAGRKYHGSN